MLIATFYMITLNHAYLFIEAWWKGKDQDVKQRQKFIHKLTKGLEADNKIKLLRIIRDRESGSPQLPMKQSKAPEEEFIEGNLNGAINTAKGQNESAVDNIDMSMMNKSCQS